jgi:putative transposase
MYFDKNLLRIEGFPRGEKIYTKWNSGFKSTDNIKFYNPTISKNLLGEYFISFSLMENKYIIENTNKNVIGIDLNIFNRFVCSNGYKSGCPDISKLIKRADRLERKIQKEISKIKKEARTKSLKYSDMSNSKRFEKRLNKKRKINNKITNIEENFIQNETSKIIKMNPSSIVMEDLSVTDMHDNKRITKAIVHCKFNRCIEVMKNKCNSHNISFNLADKFYPSSQLCSNCGNRKKIFSQKIYKCNVCGMIMDRDLNAAINLSYLG